MTTTIPPVPRPRGELTEDEKRRAEFLREMADAARDEYRDYCVGLLAAGRSFSEVSKATGLSTRTLQNWKRDAQ